MLTFMLRSNKNLSVKSKTQLFLLELGFTGKTDFMSKIKAELKSKLLNLIQLI